MKTLPIAMLLSLPTVAAGQGSSPYRGPIIDVHLHAYAADGFDSPTPNPATGQMSVKTADEHFKRTLELMKQHNVVLGIVSATSVAVVAQWEAAAPDRILRGITFDDPAEFMKPEELDQLLRENELDVVGEVGAQYAGYSPSDPAFRSLLGRCREARRSGRDPYRRRPSQNPLHLLPEVPPAAG